MARLQDVMLITGGLLLALVMLLSYIGYLEQDMNEQIHINNDANPDANSDAGEDNGNASITLITIGRREHIAVEATGQRLLDELNKHHNVSTDLSGKLIQCIDDVCPGSGFRWTITNNGRPLFASAGSYKLKSNDSIEITFTE